MKVFILLQQAAESREMHKFSGLVQVCALLWSSFFFCTSLLSKLHLDVQVLHCLGDVIVALAKSLLGLILCCVALVAWRLKNRQCFT